MSPFSSKAKQWTIGRKVIQETYSQIQPDERPIWVHSASLGEFEQARPIVDQLRVDYPQKKILLSFFSASGYIPRKNYKNADYVTYLPLDTKKNAQQFLNKVNPSLVIWIKYDLWYFHLTEIKKRNIPLVLVAAQFRDSQIYFRSYASFYKKALQSFSHFFVQNKSSKDILANHQLQNATIAPDTRFDRVYTIAQQTTAIPEIELFKNRAPLIIAGSSWPQDEKVLKEFMEQLNVENQPKLLLVPHEINESHLQQIEELFKGETQRFTQCKKEDLSQIQVLILDTMGMLSAVYRYADFAFIGGGFGKGIHNILEAVVYGVPVFIGPNYQKFQEAKDLVEAQTVFPVNSSTDLLKSYNEINNPQKLAEIARGQDKYIQEHLGGTAMVLEYLKVNHF